MAVPNVFKWVVDNLTGIMPVTVIHEYQRGVLFGYFDSHGEKFRFWKWRFNIGQARHQDLLTGLHFYIPGIQSIEAIHVRHQTKHLWKASIMTKDGQSVAVRSNFGYSIWSAWRMFTRVDDFEQTMMAEAEVALTTTIRNHDFIDLQTNMESVERDMIARIQPLAKKWGAKIHTFSITECVNCFHVRWMQ
jgi:regulator of protease activity HflC (stomatin/prohibitin superfamily)